MKRVFETAECEAVRKKDREREATFPRSTFVYYVWQQMLDI